jgi:alpha-glucosidase (family GH31 glycosyl hydrolase)
MISHNPAGLGNPYRIEPDQRFPYLVPTGTAFDVRFTTDANVGAATVLLRSPDGEQRLEATRLDEATPVDNPSAPKPAPRPPVVATEGHLTEAAARAGTQADRAAWIVAIDATLAVPGAEYRIDTDAGTSDWFTVLVVGAVALPTDVVDLGDGSRLPFDVVGTVDLFGLVHEVEFSLPCLPGDHIVGFGERFDALDQRGRNIDTRVYEQYKGQGARTYLPIPFAHVIGSDWAFWIEGANSIRYDVAASRPHVIRVTVEVAPQEHPRVTGRVVHGTPTECVQAFLEAHGGVALPPDWVFSLWLSSNEWNTQERVEREVQRAIDEGIDTGVVVIEAWADEATFAVFRDTQYTPVSGDDRLRLEDLTFPEDGAWPDPKGMIDRLHERGIRLVLWQIPVLKERGEEGSQTAIDWDEAIERGMVVLDEQGKPYRNRGFWFHDAMLPDFTDARVRRWWTERRRYLVEEMGVDGFKTDGGEHPWGAGLRYDDGTTGAETNNRFPVLYAQAYHELMTRVGVDPVTFSRAGHTGSAAFPCFWAGDEDSTWDAYRAAITAGLTAGASGISFWGFDIGGFSGPIPSPELYLRATAMATLCPIMQVHSEFNHHREPNADRTPWNLAERHDDPSVLETFRSFTRLRTRLTPYIVSEARHSVASGRPLMAALCFDHVADPSIWDAPTQYMFGRELLVCPVTEEGVSESRVYLPAGEWTDVWSGAVHAGGQWLVVPAPLDGIPVFAKVNGTHWHATFSGART